MFVVVDANIVFSAILNTDGKIGDLLLNSNGIFQFIAPDFLRTEIRLHYDKLMKLLHVQLFDVQEIETQVYKNIAFVSEEQISPHNWQTAHQIVADIDVKDTVYVAYLQEFECLLWTGDKRLIQGLRHKNLQSIVTTDELLSIRNNLQAK
ncbi:hypothetical protein FACS189456_3690 [Bacteroidia bacterium]|nr:hypothetical protein FACS189456_3690 [Bacteroidia bacterium]